MEFSKSNHLNFLINQELETLKNDKDFNNKLQEKAANEINTFLNSFKDLNSIDEKEMLQKILSITSKTFFELSKKVSLDVRKKFFDNIEKNHSQTFNIIVKKKNLFKIFIENIINSNNIFDSSIEGINAKKLFDNKIEEINTLLKNILLPKYLLNNNGNELHEINSKIILLEDKKTLLILSDKNTNEMSSLLLENDELLTKLAQAIIISTDFTKNKDINIRKNEFDLILENPEIKINFFKTLLLEIINEQNSIAHEMNINVYENLINKNIITVNFNSKKIDYADFFKELEAKQFKDNSLNERIGKVLKLN